MTEAAFSLHASQRLAVSPRLQQAVRLLQLSALDFAQEMRQALASNPFLETEDNSDTVDRVAPSPEPRLTACETVGARRYAERDTDACDWLSAPQGLREHLLEQVHGQAVGARGRLAATAVVEALDDDGYLRGDLAETAAALAAELRLAMPPTAAELAHGVTIVQGLDPVGVAARSLTECLDLQLAALDGATPGRALARRVIDGHLEALARRDYAALQNRLDCSGEALRDAQACIRRLDPRPGQRFSSAPAEYVIPDVLIREVDGELAVSTNPAVVPRARINRGYVDLLQRARHDAGPGLRRQLQEARWLLRNAEQRLQTIRRVAETIVARQQAFFAYGEVALKPLLLRAVADDLGLHESTVSRATGNKYMATPRGLIEFRRFFSPRLATDTGGNCSATAVRALIRELIADEPGDAPLSDPELARLLTGQGIQVARRTVAKYRNQLKLPPAELRRGD